jgi:hypothetical protein
LRSFTVRSCQLLRAPGTTNIHRLLVVGGDSEIGQRARTQRPRVDCEGSLPRDATPKAYSTMSSSKPHADFTQERGRRPAQERSNHYAPDSLLAHLRRGELHRQALANEQGAAQQRMPDLILDRSGAIFSTANRGRSLENLRDVLEHASEILEEAAAVVSSAAERPPSGARRDPSTSPERRKRPHPPRRRHSYPPSQ